MERGEIGGRKRMDFIFGIVGLTGGLLCAVADIFLDLKGSGNVKLGKYKFIDSNWANNVPVEI
jgi:hypothetical protein